MLDKVFFFRYNVMEIWQNWYGLVAQLGERTVRIRKVESSILFVSTMKKASRKTCFFQRNKSTPWICEMRFVREIRLRRVKCLRAWVDLFHFTSEQSEDISQFAKQIISHRRQPIFHSFSRGFNTIRRFVENIFFVVMFAFGKWCRLCQWWRYR